MRRRRTLLVLALGAVIAGGSLFYRRWHTPPMVAPPAPPISAHLTPPAVMPPPVPSPPHPPAHARTASISGVVLDPDGHVLPHALISATPAWMSNSRYAIESVHTNSAGAFELAGIELDDRVNVTVTAAEEEGSAPFPPVSEVLEAPAKNVRIQVTPGASLEGTVVDDGGRGVSGIAVSLQVGDSAVRTTRTDAHGTFRFNRLGPGRYRVLARETDQSGVVLTVTGEVGVGSEPIVHAALSLPEMVKLSIFVVDDGGRPVASIPLSVEASREDADSGRTSGHMVTSSTGGSVDVQVPAESHLSVTVADLPDYEDASAEATAEDGTLRVVLKRTRTLTGRILGREGQPIASFRVNGQDFTAPDGRFQLSTRLVHEGSLRVEANEYAETGVVIPVRASSSVDLGDIVLSEGRTVVGRILDDVSGRPVEGADVGWALDCYRSHSTRRCTESDAEGWFTLFRVPNAAQSLWVEDEGFLKQHVPLSDAPTYVQVRLDPGASIAGHAWTSAGHPAAGVKVQADGDGASGTAVADRGGQFFIHALAAGDYTVKTFADDGILPVRVSLHGRETAEVELKPPPHGTRVLVRVVDADGAPVGVTDVWAVPGDLAHEINNSDVANARWLKQTAYEAQLLGGEEVIQHVPAGELTVVVERGTMPYAVTATVPPSGHFEVDVRAPDAFSSIDVAESP